ncbi:MAG: hypothetical protein H0X63_07750 [Flavobacteriales bacterium]|nr:hypothetical protein [Flavobacteriales bacterium]
MRYLMFYFAVFYTCFAFSQNKQLIYGVEEIPQSLLLNPGGNVPLDQKFHFGIPLFSQLHINAGSSGVTAFDIFGESDININARIRASIFEMKNTDFFTVTQQLEITHFGWRNTKDYYFTGGIYQELDMITYFPRDLAILAWEGNRDYLNYEFDLGDLNTSGDLLTVFHFGANRQVSDRLTLGARAKIYSSIFNYQSTNNSGSFVTRLGDGTSNIYEHILQDADVSVQTSGYASLRNSDEVSGSSDVLGKFLGRAFLGGNLGLGMDMGATYEINKNWSASASILDFGAIFHTKDIENYRASGNYTLNGIELIFPPLSEGEATFPYYTNLEDEITEQVPVDTLYNAYTVWRPLKLNAGITYRFGKLLGGNECDCRNKGGDSDSQSLGLQFYSIFRPKAPHYAATLFYYRSVTNFLSAKVTYTVDAFSMDNLGLGIVGDFGKFNVYLAADNLLRYENLAKANSLSLQLGFNIKIEN